MAGPWWTLAGQPGTLRAETASSSSGCAYGIPTGSADSIRRRTISATLALDAQGTMPARV